jgi:hypothetical protein
MVFNATFNNISVISWRQLNYLEMMIKHKSPIQLTTGINVKRRVHEDASQGMYMSKIEISFFTA